MYLTIKEAAEYLSISEPSLEKLIVQKKVRAVFDGEQYLVYKDQFETHVKQLEKYRSLVEEIMNEPIPEDRDIKDED
ncbi:excisionase family DNA-binding protein [Cytobacillus spongiae]|jgi:excisionase family DNA binding protein|uniref:excisionase family DNA-binding protein n=1 Tax=Cytobacillus spongiae TaxID=2901381 RepID=UPI001F225FFD|nr:excisionase family DNA-binding protein [Cytobacillus spongiae]UII56453.1 excisionase family DNA-binding protein [Cytobacillus spongiae]